MNIPKSETESCGLIALATIIAQSELFTRYRQAFRQLTGRLLRFTTSSQDESDEGNIPRVTRLRIPVKLDNRLLGFLVLDPCKISDATNARFDDLACGMLDAGTTPTQLRAAREDFDRLPTISQSLAQAMETMLRIFADQLGEFAEKIFIHSTGTEPATIAKAKSHIMKHLADVITLENVASHAGVSVCHFCKVFKKSTGLTFTEYLTKARVEEAKRHLLRPQTRVTDVAYDVGFQSLSQFNRSFKRLTTQSPTEFRCSHTRLLPSSAA